MTEPKTPEEFAALRLASNHAFTTTLDFQDQIRWACDHWPEFLDQVTPAIIDDIRHQADDFHQWFAWCIMVASPEPAHDAPPEEWDAFYARVRRRERAMDRLPRPKDDATDDDWHDFWKDAAGE